MKPDTNAEFIDCTMKFCVFFERKIRYGKYSNKIREKRRTKRG